MLLNFNEMVHNNIQSHSLSSTPLLPSFIRSFLLKPLLSNRVSNLPLPLSSPPHSITQSLNHSPLAVKTNFIEIMMMVLTILYIPITRTILSATVCVGRTCPAGSKFVDKSSAAAQSRDVTSFSLSKSFCETCAFLDKCIITNELCPEVSDIRLVADSSLSCPREIYPFYVPAGALIFFCFTIGMPLLWHKLTNISEKFLNEMPADGITNAEKWNERQEMTENSASSLYGQYEYGWRYYKLYLMVQRLILVAISVYFNNNPYVATLLMSCIHGLFTGLSMYSRPYISDVLDFVATATNWSLMCNSLFALALTMGINLNNDHALGLILTNIGLPILGLCFGSLVHIRREKEMENRLVHVINQEGYPQDESDIKLPEGLSFDTIELIVRLDAADEFTESEQEEIRKAIDRKLNEYVLRDMIKFFLIMGILSFTAFGFSALGIVYGSTNSFLIPDQVQQVNTTQQYMQQHEFARYNGWRVFVDQCCCESGFSSGDTLKTELWSCKNGYKKERVRQIKTAAGATDDALSARPFCSKFFDDNVCGPFYQKPATADTLSYYKIASCTNVTLGLTEFATERLW
eukprot:TRINITY_DN676_c2_g1_i18.p2 TRINITY_DN676_c2_g1~~TRINITY_DN676_c2_g1_i18.p2  ORF type:complete len:576 (+),score=111.56 TRINITY_DN676_c2_g1_i18:1008-2735(+)